MLNGFENMEKALIFSPPQRRPKKKQTIIEDPSDIVVLAPFTKTPRLMLNDVMLGCTSTTSLIIKNPTSCEVQVWVSPPKVKLTLSWETIIIKASSEETLTISWTPDKVFAGCSIIKIQADNGMKKDISIILKSIEPVVKKKINNSIKGGVKKPQVCTQQSNKFRKVIQATQKTLRTEITTAFSRSVPTISYSTISNKTRQNYSNKENISNNTSHHNFCSILDASEFSFSRVSPLSKINVSSTPNTDNKYFNSEFNDLVAPLPTKGFFSPTLDISGIDLLTNKNKRQISTVLESSIESKINSLCFTPIHSSSMIKNKKVTETADNNTYTVHYNNGFVNGIQSGRMSSPINLSSESIVKDAADGAPTNSTYQLNSSSGTYKICASPEIHDDILAIDDYLINKKRKNLDNVVKERTQKAAKIKITYSKSSSHEIIKDLDVPEDTSVDPFIFSTMFYDEQYFEQQELHIQKWLNALLQPPSELECQVETKVNLGKLWNDVKNKPLKLPLTKEAVSHQVHTNHRLQSLRNAARKLFKEFDLIQIFTRCTYLVENETLSIRADKQLHLDVSLQKYVMELFLCYNPLWLRIGLETVCNEQININSNSDIHGLSVFIYNRLFKGQNISGKQNNIFKNEIVLKLKKFVLKKFLMLVLFLDRAKKDKLIAHDPCLFTKTAPFKESRLILVNFSKELIAGIGDITRPLKTIGYIVTHKQSYVDEFDFAVKNLATDIRDGIRLAKIMEIILLRKDLLRNLRAPPISRLQKIFNVSISFKALEEIGFVLFGNITPRDITDGYKEKTLSLFWQLIYKFQAPLFVKASTTIQCWWRSETIQNKRRELQHKRLLKEISATFIQSAWRGYKARLNYKILRFRYNRSAKVIQKAWMLYQERVLDEVYRQNKAAIKIQKAFKSYILMKKLRIYIETYTNAVILIQRRVRNILITKKARNDFLQLRNTTILIQRRYRAKLAMLCQLTYYENLRTKTIFLQRYYRNKIVTRQIRNNYLNLKNAAIIIQRRFRARQSMLKAKKEYQLIKTSATTIQNYYKAYKLMKEIKQTYIKLRWATTLIQQKFRAKLAMKRDREHYVKLKEVVIYLQRKFRANKTMRCVQNEYITMKNSALTIQKYYKAYKAMKVARLDYLNIKNATLVLQRRFRAKLAMRKAVNDYSILKKATTTIQLRYRSLKCMQKVRSEYLEIRESIIVIQNRYRAVKAMRVARANYLNIRNAAVVLQTRFRAQLAMKKEYYNYNQLKSSVILIQRKYKAIKLMQIEKTKYMQLKQAVIYVQQKYRAKLAMKKHRKDFQQLKYYTLFVQRRIRMKLIVRIAMYEFKLLRSSAIVIQNRFRAQRAMIEERQKYQLLVRSAIKVQRRFRANKLMKQCRSEYLKKINSIIYIQQKWRATLLKRQVQDNYNSLRNSALIIQRRYRAQNLMKILRHDFITLRENVKIVQTRYRAQMAMKSCYHNYNLLKKYVIYVQRQFRANRIGKHIKQEYCLLRKSVIAMQRRYRANKAAKAARNEYLELKEKTVFIQNLWRAKLAMRNELQRYTILRNATIKMQRIFRSTHVLICSNDPKRRRVISVWMVIKIQAWWRGVRVRRKMPPKLRTIVDRLKNSYKVPNKISLKDKVKLCIEHILSSTRCDVTVYETLDLATRVYPQSFENSAMNLAQILYVLIICNNRSVPELQIASRCSEILVNLSKHSKTLVSMLFAEQIPELLVSASRFCDKETQLFCNICTILWTFGHHDKTKFIVKRILHKTDCKKTIQLIAKKVARLDVMQNNLRKGTKVKTPMLIPLLIPDYGLPRKYPRTFTNPKFGMQCIIQIFNIGIEI